ncbi:unnamed protein product [Tuber melanosporum]|uniref:(Perigord truffle) hypothetical protein n=1 Tax=Tuber melanosporum (strain Mel28) TaxID=656061 RepID=D5G747_TUBMM|nr:uncharacterized protein GSTUM_00002341001 [Tuber melanosporum]CAZ80340.1 unnamed protein product [Tuber melanosporum]
MAKKRRNPTSVQPKAPRGIDPNDAKIGPIGTWEDVADEEDAFHISRDKVLLEDDVFDEDGPSDEEKGEEDEELLEGWGSSRKDYYNDPSAPEEAEESEALRLQSRHLSSLSANDFLFNAAEWTIADPPSPIASTTVAKVIEQLPSVPLSSLSEEERTKRLHLLHPEFPLLAKEFSELEPLHASLGLSAAAAEAVGETVRSSVAIVKFRALSAYLGVLSMYFAVLTAGDEVAQGEGGMQDHGVMEGLVKCRGMWEAVKSLEVEEISSREGQGKKKKKKRMGEDGKEKDGKLVNTMGGKGEPERKKVKICTTAASKAPSKKSIPGPTKPESDFDSDIEIDFSKPTPTARPPPTTSTFASTSHFGDPTYLSHPDALSKSAKKRTLRFYTSQIVSKSATRASAAQSHSGDMDLPHKERSKERAIRLQAEAARKRSAADPTADLGYSSGGEGAGPVPRRGKNEREEEEEEEEDEYMRLLKTSGKEKKAAKKAAHDQSRDALRSGARVDTECGEAGGKRAIGYTISKNKGLTPFRKKEVRNPRVKKRMKYDAAKKKLGSVRAVYKGGLKGAYAGEATGIKGGLVRSIKLS